MEIPSAFARGDDEFGPINSIPEASGDGARLARGPRGGMKRGFQRVDEEATSDRCLPMIHFSRADMKRLENPIDAQGQFFMGQEMDPIQHLEYLGQRLVSIAGSCPMSCLMLTRFHLLLNCLKSTW